MNNQITKKLNNLDGEESKVEGESRDEEVEARDGEDPFDAANKKLRSAVGQPLASDRGESII